VKASLATFRACFIALHGLIKIRRSPIPLDDFDGMPLLLLIIAFDQALLLPHAMLILLARRNIGVIIKDRNGKYGARYSRQ
jgi:hypothetical protein